MSRSGRKLFLLFPVLIFAAFVMQRGSSEVSEDPVSASDGESRSSLPALAAWEEPAGDSSRAAAPDFRATAVPRQLPAPVDRPARAQAGETVTIRMLVTAYCPCPKCCGEHSDGITASGKDVYTNNSRFVAADISILPFGTKISIPGYNDGEPVPVLDRGGKIKGHRLDVFFLSHDRALQWGRQWLDVTVHLD